MNFIELTNTDGSKFIGNINLLQRVCRTSEGITYIIGWSNNGVIEVKETYEEVIAKINARLAGVNRLK
jgi:hypothetical protein